MRIIEGPEAEQGSPAWHAFRKNKVMASMAPVIVGSNPYCTRYQLWRQILDLDQVEETDAMRNGKLKEPEALELVNKIIGCEFKPCVAIHSQYDWLGASFDGVSIAGTIVEIKTPYRASDAVEWWEKNEDIYYPQLQVQMAVSDELCCHVFVYMGNGEGRSFSVNRDDSYISKMIPKLKEFHDCVMGLTPPPLTEKDFLIKEGGNWELWSLRHKEAKLNMDYWEKRHNEIRKQLIDMTEGQNTKSHGITLQKIVSKGRVDYQKIIEDYNIDVEKYRSKPTETWRINVE